MTGDAVIAALGDRTYPFGLELDALEAVLPRAATLLAVGDAAALHDRDAFVRVLGSGRVERYERR